MYGSFESIALVKATIVVPGLFILIPAIAVSEGTGFALSKRRNSHLVETKKRRMPFVGTLGLLILLPAAIVLNQWA